MAESAVTFLLQNLRDLVVYQIKLSTEAKFELDQLQQHLETMKALLEDAADKKSKGKAFRLWEKRIRELVYEAEDLIDSFITQEQAAKKKTVNFSTRTDVSGKMNDLRLKKIVPSFENAKRELSSLPTSDEPDARTRNTRQVNPLVDKTVVGFEDEIENLIDDLTNNGPEIEAISIIGMPGLGKTTVASKIFRDSRVDFQFPTRIWINVSEDYKARDIYLIILRKFTDRDSSMMSDDELALKAQEHLSQVKFLLVLDDVWTAEAWSAIKKVLPSNKKGSGKVLVTSRFAQVATKANPHREPHRLRFLYPHESWKLLQFEVYGKEGAWPTDSTDIGRTISEKCGGLPLALVVIGGILLDKLSPPESRKAGWEEVSQSVEQYLLKDDKEKEVSMKNIIALSYDKMPYYLRECFLYLGVCPKDFEISAWKLTRLWIAEGFIKQEDNSSQRLEGIAEENLMELIRRNLVMVGRKNARGEVKTCRVHDMIREFCKKEAGFEELNFLQVISKSSMTGHFSPAVSEIHKFRRICVHSSVLDFLEKKPYGPRTRSFISFSKHETNAQANSLQSIVDAFELLRVFEGGSIKFPRFQPKLAKLIHLRYLTFAAGENFKALPDCIVDLLNLQTLVITTSHATFEIKADISSMIRLRHLKTKAAIVLHEKKKLLGKKKSDPNENLQTLTRLSSQSCTEEVLSKTPNIQTLGIYGETESLCNIKGLEKLRFLRRLMIIASASETRIQRLLEEKQFPPCLKILTLSTTDLEWHYMSTLGRLKLEALKVKDNAFGGDEWKVSPGEFKYLEYLHIERSNLLIWTIEDGAFPKLRSLYINNCERLLSIPLHQSKSLQTLEIGVVSRTALDSAKKIEEELKATRGFKLIVAPSTKT